MKKAIVIGAAFLSSIFSMKAQSEPTCFSPAEKEKVEQYEMVITSYAGTADSTASEARLEYISALFSYQNLLTNKIDLEKAADEERLQKVQDLNGMRHALDLETRLTKVKALLAEEMKIGFGPKAEVKTASAPASSKQP
jgi:ribosomal protein S13